MGNAAWMKVIDNETVNATASVYSRALEVGSCKNFGICIKVDSGTTPDVKVQYQVIPSRQNQESFVGTVSGNEEQLSWVTPEVGATIISSITSESKANGFSPMVSQWLRIKVTGNASNGADTKVTVYLSIYHET